MGKAVLSVEELNGLLAKEFPQAFNPLSGLDILDAGHGRAKVRQAVEGHALRPGGTVSGPTLMALADVCAYVAILASIGWVPLAVTTNLNINFLRKPAAGRAVIGDCRLIKLGRRLAVGEIAIRSEGEDELVAHATATYSIPPAR